MPRTSIPRKPLTTSRFPFALLLILMCQSIVGGLSVSAAIELAWFEAHSGSRIRLEWKTGSETQLAGFFVRRSEKGGKAPEKYTRTEVEDKAGKRTTYISPGSDPVAGSSYEYWDPGAQKGRTYHYLLEVIDTNNQSEFHGPVKAFSRANGAQEDAR